MTYLALVAGWCILAELGYWGYRFCALRATGEWTKRDREAVKMMALLLAPFLAAVVVMALIHEFVLWCTGDRNT